MTWRGLLALLALFLALLAVVLWVDSPRKEEGAEAKKSLATIVPASLGEVRAIEVEGHQAPLRVERGEGPAWQLVLPIRAEADPREVETYYSALIGVPLNRVVEEKGADLLTFGLSSPEGRIRVFAATGSGVTEILVGRASPVGDGRYATDGSGRVLLLGGGIVTSLDRSAASLRERRLLPFAADAVRRLSVASDSGRVTVRRDGTEWKLVEPVEDEADAAAVDALVRAAVGLSAVDFPTSGTAEDDASRFTGPGLTVTAEIDGEATPRIVRVGADGPEGKRWARRESGEFSCLVDTAALSGVTREPLELRDRTVTSVDPGAVRGMTIRGGDGPEVAAQRDAPDGSWSVREAGGAWLPAAPRSVEDLLDRLKWLRASSFVSSEPPGKELRTVILEGESGELGRLDLYAHPEAPGNPEPPAAERRISVRLTWRPGWILEVRAEALGSLPSKAADLTAASGEAGKPETP